MRAASAPLAREVRVETIADYGSFLKLERIWNTLVDEAGIHHPFLSHEWMRIWWESFGAGKELHVLMVRAGGDAIAIAPLMLSRGWMYGLRVRRLEFIRNVHTPRSDFIIAHRPEEAYRAIWKHLLDQRALWDVLTLCEIPTPSRTLDELPKLAAEDGLLVTIHQSVNSPYLSLLGAWDNYVTGLDQKHRSNLRNRLKRLSQLGRVELEAISSSEQLGKALDDGLQLEAAAWKGKAGTAIRCRPALRSFYTRLADGAAKRGWLRLHFLTVDGRRIAFQYSLYYKDKLYLLKPGYDPDYALYSPGNVLCFMVLRDAFQRGLAEHDFLGVDDAWKLDWTRETRSHYSLLVPGGLQTRLLFRAWYELAIKLKPLCIPLRDVILRLGNGNRGSFTANDRTT